MKIIIPLFIVLFISSCSSKESRNGANFLLQPEDFKSKVDAGATLIDVRTVEEYAGGHISGSLNMDVNNAGFKDNVQMLDKSKTYAVYCASGVRSGKAAEQMRELGFTSVFTLAGGVKAWSDKGLPLE
jgi:rhodanese-related sulfurtransferase